MAPILWDIIFTNSSSELISRHLPHFIFAMVKKSVMYTFGSQLMNPGSRKIVTQKWHYGHSMYLIN